MDEPELPELFELPPSAVEAPPVECRRRCAPGFPPTLSGAVVRACDFERAARVTRRRPEQYSE